MKTKVVLILIVSVSVFHGYSQTGCVSGNCWNGYGSYHFADGAVYMGEWKNGKFCGQGTYNYSNGDKYIGEWKDDYKEGQGTYYYYEGAIYVGGWKDDYKNGQGTLTNSKGSKFVWDKNGYYVGESKTSEIAENNTNNHHDSVLMNDLSLKTNAKNNITNEQLPDLDINSIKTLNKNPNAFAVVIGNKDYHNTKQVNFAINDARMVKDYLINVLGYKEGNIFYLENITKSNFETYFGTKENPKGKLYNNIKQGISDVFIYYSGHGAQGLKDNKGYIVPVDCDPQYIEQGGYPLDVFYTNIFKLNAKQITVIMDACFSGTQIIDNTSPVNLKIQNPIAIADNCVVLSSSTGSQVSSWYNNKRHGMFTYFVLKSIQDKEKSDKNKDGKLTYEELFEYISDKTEGVPYYARSIHGIDQTPTIEGNGSNNVFVEYK
jgi:hypothetical protein